MGEVTKIDMHEVPAPKNNEPTPEVAARMIQQAKTGVTSVQTEAPVKAERPSWLPEKFKTPEDMAKSYLELEKKMAGNKQPPTPTQTTPAEEKKDEKAPETKVTKPADLKVPEEVPAKADAEKVVEKAGLKMDALEAEFAEKGSLSEASLKSLEAAGIPKQVVDSYIAGQMALAEKINTELHAVAGGEEKFNEMFEWSKTADSLTPADRSAINKAIDSKDLASIKLAFQGVHSKWIAEVGQPPKTQLRGGKSNSTADVYTSRDALMKDMSNPEYKTNESFRNAVAQKLKRSNIL